MEHILLAGIVVLQYMKSPLSSGKTTDQSLLLRGVDCGHGRDHGVDVALVANIGTPAYLVVSVLPPVLTPRVLDDPVRLVLQADGGKTSCAIANKENTMVKGSATDVWT